MTDIAELVQRLRSLRPLVEMDSDSIEAADALEAQAKRIEELSLNLIGCATHLEQRDKRIEELENTCADAVNDMGRAEARLESATKRIAELVEAIMTNEKNYDIGFAEAIEMAVNKIAGWPGPFANRDEAVSAIKALKPPQEE